MMINTLQEDKEVSGSMEDMSTNSSSSGSSGGGSDGSGGGGGGDHSNTHHEGCDDSRSSRLLDKHDPRSKDKQDLPSSTDHLTLGQMGSLEDEPLDKNLKEEEGDLDASELKITSDARKTAGEGKKGSVSLNLKRSPSSSGQPLTPSRPASRELC